MNEMRTELLQHYIALAKELRSLAHPTRAALAEILSALSHDDVAVLESQKVLDPTRIEAIAKAVGFSKVVVEEVLSAFLRNDFRDYSAWYHDCLSEYRGEPNATFIVSDVLRQPTSDPHHFILFRKLLYCWCPKQGTFYDVRVRDDHALRCTAGYLIESGRAFPSTLALLKESCIKQWTNWTRLWDCF